MLLNFTNNVVRFWFNLKLLEAVQKYLVFWYGTFLNLQSSDSSIYHGTNDQVKSDKL